MTYQIGEKKYDISPEEFATTLSKAGTQAFAFVNSQYINQHLEYFTELKKHLDTHNIQSFGFSLLSYAANGLIKQTPIKNKETLFSHASSIDPSKQTTQQAIDKILQGRGSPKIDPKTAIVCKSIEDLPKVTIALDKGKDANPFILSSVMLLEEREMRAAKMDRSQKNVVAAGKGRPHSLPSEAQLEASRVKSAMTRDLDSAIKEINTLYAQKYPQLTNRTQEKSSLAGPSAADPEKKEAANLSAKTATSLGGELSWVARTEAAKSARNSSNEKAR